MTILKLDALTKIAATALFFLMLGCGPTPPGPQELPSDALNSCPVTSTLFATWFQSGSASLNGVVNPADSVHFSNSPNCDFYRWSEQMFLWLTSPAPATYGGGGGRILDSPAFYDVSPEVGGKRTFLAHASGGIRVFNLRAAQVGAHGLPVIFDRSGRMLEVTTPLAAAVLQVRTVTGTVVPVAHARLDKAGRPVLLDKTGKVIEVQIAATTRQVKPTDNRNEKNPFLVQRFNLDGIQIFIDPSLAVVDVEQGQADGGVLEAQNGSLVYYATIVNDVYAYFATGVKDGGITPAPNVFPTSQADLNKVVTFAAAHGKTFPDPNALAVEIKSSWVEAAGLANLSNYITMTATVPTYDRSNPAQWVPNGQKTVQLALVGMHVVGSTAGHPEMIWATFEHVANAPTAPYSYINASNHTIPLTPSTAASWVFAANGSGGPFNQMHMQASGLNIVPRSGFSISPSDTMRMKAFGATSDISPNPLDGTTAASNSEVISANNSVRGMITGDVRSNYVLTGATWTIGGASPQPLFQNPTPGNLGNQVGTSQLSNSTMETYQQGTGTNSIGGSNCFSCHVNTTLSSSATTDNSHVFSALQPLF
jgi:hypothetical protein